MPPSFENSKMRRGLTPALEAIRILTAQAFNENLLRGQFSAVGAHAEIEHTAVNQRTGPFYRHFVPLRQNLISLLAIGFRRYFKLALAHPDQTGRNPNQWACGELQPFVGAALEWIRDWYMVACDGENQYVQRIAQVPFVLGETVSIPIPLTASPFPSPESWRAPAWLFEISLTDVGVGPLKTKNIPATNSEQRLGAAHTRLLLKGARRVFLWELGAAVERVRNEEVAACAIPAERAEAVSAQTRQPNKRRGWEQRSKLYNAIQKALSGNPSLQGIKLCAELDRRHAPPLYDWKKRGEWREGLTWKEAWGNLRLRKKIRRVRQEALKPR